MGTHVAKLRRTESGNHEAVVYEVTPKKLTPVLVVHGSEALVSRAVELATLAGDFADGTGPGLPESGAFPAAVADHRDASGDLRKGSGTSDD
jgi:hypothetical protein